MGITQDLCEYDSKLYAAWKGETGDDRIFYSFYDGTNWVEQSLAGGNTSSGPSMGKHGGKMFLAWKGEHSDERLFCLNVEGGLWSSQVQIPGFASSVGPSLADFNGQLYAAWKGALDDQAIWFASTADGSNWSGQQTIPNVGTSVGPSLCNYRGRLYAAWKGMNNDQALWFASFDGTSWGPQAQIPGVASSVGPALATYQEKLYAIWKGVIGDEGLYFSYFDGTSWTPQQNIPGNTGTDGPVNIGMGLQYQETSQWCWLAVAASVAHYYNGSSGTTQCDLMTTIGQNINHWPNTTVCCPDGGILAAHPDLPAKLADPYSTNAEYCLETVGIPQVCIKSGGVGDALNVNGNNAGWHPDVSLGQIASEVAAGRPVCVDIQWPSGGGHVVAIAGVLNDQILVLDPANGESVIAFEDFPSQYSGGAKLLGYTFTKAP